MSSSTADSLVIDAGVGYALCVRDEAWATLRADVAASIRSGIRLYAPGMWRYEVTLWRGVIPWPDMVALAILIRHE